MVIRHPNTWALKRRHCHPRRPDATLVTMPLTFARSVTSGVGKRRPSAGGRAAATVSEYWERHTVPAPIFESVEASLRQLEQRSAQYPLFSDFMDLSNAHQGDVVLDYGCGPGNDLVQFLVHSSATRIVGVDVSARALALARARLELHGAVDGRVELMRTPESHPRVPLSDGSVDYVHCAGVLQHATDPSGILAELRRVLRPGGSGRIMVYNRDSTWFHLYVAYRLIVRTKEFAGLAVEEAFQRSTDGFDCPIARCYRPAEFLAMCTTAGFEAAFVGGYPSNLELEVIASDLKRARRSRRLAAEHRAFLATLTIDDRGYPMSGGKHAGIGGVYVIRRR
jgi:ubiquinone/menaquinone biosynthesis C-methylase UbiE